MPTLTVNSEEDAFNEDQTLLALYNLAGEESGGFITFRPHLLHTLNRILIAHHILPSPPRGPDTVEVRELRASEIGRIRQELSLRFRAMDTDPSTTCMFAAFNGTRLVGVARCVRHPDGLELDGIYILEEVRRKGFVRGITALLIEALGKQDVLYVRAAAGVAELYHTLGFHPVQEADLPVTLRGPLSGDKAGKKSGASCAMRRERTQDPAGQNTVKPEEP
ncbi:GNAT family N-acetyltransferase [Methanoregula sp.]|uniref:GNAT family N-acetyltransferase n=1 Tax=Methanoregula sp. TaxID=2052170 RepID=UPI003C21B102